MDVAAFLAWVGVGLALSVTVLSAGSFAPLLIVTGPATLGLAVSVYRRFAITSAAFGLGPGFAVVWLVIAYTNRHGPGLYCHLVGSPPNAATECRHERDPKPFLAAGAVLLAGLGWPLSRLVSRGSRGTR
jgi:hypothetical protein